jgi:glycosyltransferase involved in cell wall biosynthesis
MARDAGLALVWDNDDDLRSIDAPSRDQKQVYGGYRGNRVFREMIGIMRSSQVITAPSATLADRFHEVSGADVRVIENHVESIVEPARSRWWTKDTEPVVVGWVANREHRADVDRLRLREPLQRLLDENPNVEVMTVGCGLSLDGRYSHVPGVAFGDLREHVSRFDVGIAPIADTTFNRARSSIKVKEYAALGIPWLASPIGPYADLGEQQGGSLVPDDRWFDALNALVRDARRRRRLGRAGITWAKAETIGANGHVWEAVMAEAAAKVPSRTAGRT